LSKFVVLCSRHSPTQINTTELKANYHSVL